MKKNYLAILLTTRVFFIFSGLLLWIAMDVAYRFYVSEHYLYNGFSMEPNLFKYFESLFIYLFFLFKTPKILLRPSDYFMNFLLFALIVPLLLIYALRDEPRIYLYTVLLGYFLIDSFRNGKLIKLPIVKHGYKIALGTLVLSAFGVTAWMVVVGGLVNFNLDLRRVYEFRIETGEIINTGIMGYVNVWAYKVFGPALLAIALWRKHYFIALFVIVLHVLWFGISAHKAVLFNPFLVIIVYLLFSRTKALCLLPLAYSGVVITSLAVFFIFDYGLIASLFVRRVFFVPASNVFYYYQFFDANQFVYWSNSITSSFVSYPYHINPAELIGQWRETDGHINNSFLSTGFMHAGVAGIIFYSILVGLLFRIIDSFVNYGISNWVAISILVVPFYSLFLSADLPVSLLTHGIAVAIFILFLLRMNDTELHHLNNK
jgi:hypothetical protein